MKIWTSSSHKTSDTSQSEVKFGLPGSVVASSLSSPHPKGLLGCCRSSDESQSEVTSSLQQASMTSNSGTLPDKNLPGSSYKTSNDSHFEEVMSSLQPVSKDKDLAGISDKTSDESQAEVTSGLQPVSTVLTSGTFSDENLMSSFHKTSDTSQSEVKFGLPGSVVASSLSSPHPKGLLGCCRSSDESQSEVTSSLQQASMASNSGTLPDKNLPGSSYKTSNDSHFEEVMSSLQPVSKDKDLAGVSDKTSDESHSGVTFGLQPVSTVLTSGTSSDENLTSSSHKTSDTSQSEVKFGLPGSVVASSLSSPHPKGLLGCCRSSDESQSEVTSSLQQASMTSNSGDLSDKNLPGSSYKTSNDSHFEEVMSSLQPVSKDKDLAGISDKTSDESHSGVTFGLQPVSTVLTSGTSSDENLTSSSHKTSDTSQSEVKVGLPGSVVASSLSSPHPKGLLGCCRSSDESQSEVTSSLQQASMTSNSGTLPDKNLPGSSYKTSNDSHFEEAMSSLQPVSKDKDLAGVSDKMSDESHSGVTFGLQPVSTVLTSGTSSDENLTTSSHKTSDTSQSEVKVGLPGSVVASSLSSPHPKGLLGCCRSSDESQSEVTSSLQQASMTSNSGDLSDKNLPGSSYKTSNDSHFEEVMSSLQPVSKDKDLAGISDKTSDESHSGVTFGLQPVSTVFTSGTSSDENLTSSSHKMSDTSQSEVKVGLPGSVVASSLSSPHPKGLLGCCRSLDESQSEVTSSLQQASMASNSGTLPDKNLPGSSYKTSNDSHFEEVMSSLQPVSKDKDLAGISDKTSDESQAEVTFGLQPVSTVLTSGTSSDENLTSSSHKTSDTSQSEVKVGLPGSVVASSLSSPHPKGLLGCCRSSDESQSEVTSSLQQASMTSNSGTLPDKNLPGSSYKTSNDSHFEEVMSSLQPVSKDKDLAGVSDKTSDESHSGVTFGLQPVSTVFTSGTSSDENLTSSSHKMSDTSQSEVKVGLPGSVVASSLISSHPKGLLGCCRSSDESQSEVTSSLQQASMTSNSGTLPDKNLPGSSYKTSNDSHFEEVMSSLQPVSKDKDLAGISDKTSDESQAEVTFGLQPVSTVFTSGTFSDENLPGSSYKMSEDSHFEVMSGLRPMSISKDMAGSSDKTSDESQAISNCLPNKESNMSAVPDKDLVHFSLKSSIDSHSEEIMSDLQPASAVSTSGALPYESLEGFSHKMSEVEVGLPGCCKTLEELQSEEVTSCSQLTLSTASNSGTFPDKDLAGFSNKMADASKSEVKFHLPGSVASSSCSFPFKDLPGCRTLDESQTLPDKDLPGSFNTSNNSHSEVIEAVSMVSNSSALPDQHLTGSSDKTLNDVNAGLPGAVASNMTFLPPKDLPSCMMLDESPSEAKSGMQLASIVYNSGSHPDEDQPGSSYKTSDLHVKFPYNFHPEMVASSLCLQPEHDQKISCVGESDDFQSMLMDCNSGCHPDENLAGFHKTSDDSQLQVETTSSNRFPTKAHKNHQANFILDFPQQQNVGPQEYREKNEFHQLTTNNKATVNETIVQTKPTFAITPEPDLGIPGLHNRDVLGNGDEVGWSAVNSLHSENEESHSTLSKHSTRKSERDAMFFYKQSASPSESHEKGQQKRLDEPKYQSTEYQSPEYQSTEYQSPEHQSTEYQSTEYQSPEYQSTEYQSPEYQSPEIASDQCCIKALYILHTIRIPYYCKSELVTGEYQSTEYQSPEYQSPEIGSDQCYIKALFILDTIRIPYYCKSELVTGKYQSTEYQSPEYQSPEIASDQCYIKALFILDTIRIPYYCKSELVIGMEF